MRPLRWRAQGHLLCLTGRHLALRRRDFSPVLAACVHTRCSDLLNPQGDRSSLSNTDQVTVKGLVLSVRKQKKWSFAHITDGSTVKPIQAILTPELAEHFTTGAAVEVTGKWDFSPAQGQTSELKASGIKILGEADPKVYGFPLTSCTIADNSTYRHIQFRKNTIHLPFSVRFHIYDYVLP